MSEVPTPENGRSKEIDNAKIEFPVTFQLKAVMDSSVTDENNKENISAVLESLEIKNKCTGSKKSSKGTYVSYNYQVTLISKLQLETLYDKLKGVPGLKFAI